MYDGLGVVVGDSVIPQDEMAWIGQGPISDRTQEHLATSDKGVILYHNIILEQIARVEAGEDPMGVIRDATKNEPFIHIAHEGVARAGFARVDATGNRVQPVGQQDNWGRDWNR